MGTSHKHNWYHRIHIQPDTYFEDAQNRSKYALHIDIRFPSLDYQSILNSMINYNKNNNPKPFDYYSKNVSFYKYVDDLAEIDIENCVSISNSFMDMNFNVNKTMVPLALEMWNAQVNAHNYKQYTDTNYNNVINVILCYSEDIVQLLWKIAVKMENKEVMDNVIKKWKLKILKKPTFKNNGSLKMCCVYYSIDFYHSDYEVIIDLLRDNIDSDNPLSINI